VKTAWWKITNHESRITQGVFVEGQVLGQWHTPPPKQPLGCLSGDELWAIVEEKMNLPRVENAGREKS
jgi:hypothetical protein